MKLRTFEQRTKIIARNSNAFRYAKQLLTEGGKVYTSHTSGSGRFTTNIDRTWALKEVLITAGLKEGIDFVQLNDSPRGGKSGNYTELTKKGVRKMIV